MMLAIRHETTYRYTTSSRYTIQQLRLSPRMEPQQRVASWVINSPGKLHPFTDAYGNVSHMLIITGSHDEVRIVAEGVVDVMPVERGRLAEGGALSPLVFTVPTRLTQPTDTVIEFARPHFLHGAQSVSMLALAESIRAAVAYQSGATLVTSTATEALLLGQGVCQDHAHVFLACCHAHGVPARYVSGYIDPGSSAHAESHAWVDVWVDDADYSGWTSIDVTHAAFAASSHCRVAIGRDYDAAAPVRGVRRGGGDESLQVEVRVTAISG